MDFSYVPPRITLQWHITNRCNLRCKHCYQTEYSDNELNNLQALKTVLSQFVELVNYWKSFKKDFRSHINITGGEPFTHPEFLELLTEFGKYKKLFSFGILTNGSHITNENARFLASIKTGFVQLSMEGCKQTNDEIRFEGSFDQTLKAVKILKKHGLKVLLSFTVSNKNQHSFEKVARIASENKVDQLWADRLLPFGNGAKMNDDCLNAEQTKQFYNKMYELKNKLKSKWFNKTEITMNRALQFLCGGENMYSCSAGDKLITLMPDGAVYPCRRMPIPCGNIFQNNLKDIYYNNETFVKLRNSANNDEACKTCTFYNGCRGGLKCLSYIHYNTPFKKDPGCWL